MTGDCGKGRRSLRAAAVLCLAAVGCSNGADDSAASATTLAGRSSAPGAGAETRTGPDRSERAAAGDALAAGGGAGSAGRAGLNPRSAGGGAATAAVAGVSAAAGSGGAAAADGTSAGMAGGGAAAAAAPTLTEVYEMVYSTSCAVCHSMAPSDTSNGQLGMIRSKDQLYDSLVDKPTQGSLCTGKGTYVIPGDPQNSVVMQKLSSAAVCGATMPLGGMLQPVQLKLLGDWIAAGALKN